MRNEKGKEQYSPHSKGPSHFQIDVAEAWKKHTRYSQNGIETKLLTSGNEPQIHKGFLESTMW